MLLLCHKLPNLGRAERIQTFPKKGSQLCCKKKRNAIANYVFDNAFCRKSNHVIKTQIGRLQFSSSFLCRIDAV